MPNLSLQRKRFVVVVTTCYNDASWLAPDQSDLTQGAGAGDWISSKLQGT